jgi:hypothetical protein
MTSTKNGEGLLETRGGVLISKERREALLEEYGKKRPERRAFALATLMTTPILLAVDTLDLKAFTARSEGGDAAAKAASTSARPRS